MRSALVVPDQIVVNRLLGLTNRVVRFQIHFFIFHAAPHPLDEYVVPPGTFSIHRQTDAAPEHRIDNVCAGDPPSLGRIPPPRQPVLPDPPLAPRPPTLLCP